MFVTWPYGEPFKNSGGISNASTAMWKKAGMTGRVGANKFCKAAITASREAKGRSDPFHDDLANLMGHQKKTANHYYFLDEKLESSERAAAELPTIIRTVVRKDINPGTSGSNSQDEITNDAQMSDKVASRLNDENHLKSPARKKFTVGETHLIETLFSDEISQGKIAKSTVEECIEDEPLLSALSPKRVYEKVRSSIRFPRQSAAAAADVLPQAKDTLEDRVNQCLNVFPEEQDKYSYPDIIPPSSFGSHAKDLFSNEDKKMLKEGFKFLIQKRSVTEKGIKEAIESSLSARNISEKFSIETIRNRIKYEIRLERAKK